MFGYKKVRRKKARPVSPRERELAREVVHAKLAHFNQSYQFAYNKVFIRDVRSRWGSCSSKRNLNFSSRIARLAPELIDYVIVHELCHLGEFNHSPSFWKLVETAIPDYKTRRKKLKTAH